VPGVGHDRELQRLPVLLIEAVSAFGVTRLLDEALGLGLVVGIAIERRRIGGSPRRRGVMLEHARTLAVQDLLHDRVHVEAIGERLADALVGECGRARAPQVPADVVVREIAERVDAQVVASLDVVEVLWLDRPEVDLTALQLRREGRDVGDDLENVLVEVRRAAEVVVVPLEDDLVVRLPLLEREGAARDGRRRVLGGVVDLSRVLRTGVLPVDVRRQRTRGGAERIRQRGAEHALELHREALRIARIDGDARDRRRRTAAVFVEAIDVLERRRTYGLLAARDRLHAGEVVLAGDLTAVRPDRARFDLPAVRPSISGDRPSSEVGLDLAGLRVNAEERVVDETADDERGRIVREERCEGLRVGERTFDHPPAADGRLVCVRRRRLRWLSRPLARRDHGRHEHRDEQAFHGLDCPRRVERIGVTFMDNARGPEKRAPALTLAAFTLVGSTSTTISLPLSSAGFTWPRWRRRSAARSS